MPARDDGQSLLDQVDLVVRLDPVVITTTGFVPPLSMRQQIIVAGIDS